MRADERARTRQARAASPLAFALAAAIAPIVPAEAQPGTVAIGVTAEGESGLVTNPRFAQAADSADVASRARLGASLVRRSARGSVRAIVDGETQRFRATPELSRVTYGAATAADERLTERLAVSGAAGVRTSLSRDAVTGADLGTATVVGSTALPLLPLTLSHAYSAQVGAAYRTSPRTTVTADAGVDRIRFDARALASGTSVRARVALSRTLADATGVSATVDAHRAETDGQLLTAESLTLGWDARVGGPVRVQLRGGAGAFGTPQHATLIRPVGSAEVGAPALGGVWALRYSRDVSPVLGLGALVASDRAGASYTRVAPGGVLVRVGIEQAWSRISPTDVSRTVTNASYADVRRPIVGGLWAGIGAARRSRTQAPTVRSQNLALTAGYAGSW